VAFRPGGGILASAGDDGTVRLWDITNPAKPVLVSTIRASTDAVFRDGRTVAAADSAGLVWLWNTQAGAAARGVCAMAGQPLTRAEWHAYVPGRPYTPPCR